MQPEFLTLVRLECIFNERWQCHGVANPACRQESLLSEDSAAPGSLCLGDRKSLLVRRSDGLGSPGYMDVTDSDAHCIGDVVFGDLGR